MSNPKIQLRHDTAANWSTANPVLLDGEVGIEKGTSAVVNFDSSSTGTYNLNNGILTNPTPKLLYGTGVTKLEPDTGDSKTLEMYVAINLPTTPTHEYHTIYWFGNDDGTNELAFLRFKYSNSTWYCQLGVYANNNWEVADATIPNNRVGVWIDLKATLRYYAGTTVYRYIGIKLSSESNYNTLYDTNLNNVTSCGTTNAPTIFFARTGEENEGEANLANCSISYDRNQVWIGMSGTATPAKLKIGDGETAWNDLPYII